MRWYDLSPLYCPSFSLPHSALYSVPFASPTKPPDRNASRTARKPTCATQTPLSRLAAGREAARGAGAGGGGHLCDLEGEPGELGRRRDEASRQLLVRSHVEAEGAGERALRVERGAEVGRAPLRPLELVLRHRRVRRRRAVQLRCASAARVKRSASGRPNVGWYH